MVTCKTNIRATAGGKKAKARPEMITPTLANGSRSLVIRYILTTSKTSAFGEQEWPAGAETAQHSGYIRHCSFFVLETSIVPDPIFSEMSLTDSHSK
jgi:hypothetical protein